jgi:hypothetical protein
LKHYIVYILDRDGRVSLVHDIRCKDDLDALHAGESFSLRNAIEIWQERRLVARVKLGNAALNVQDMQCL